MANYPELKLYIDGEWRHAEGAPVINPADETVLGTVPHATHGDLRWPRPGTGSGFGRAPPRQSGRRSSWRRYA